MSFTKDGNTLIVGANDQTIRFLNVKSGEIEKTYSLDSKFPESCDVHPSKEMLACLFNDRSIEIINLLSGELNKTFMANEKYVYYSPLIKTVLRYQENGERLFINNGYDQVVYDTDAYQELSSSINIIDSLVSEDQSFSVRVKTFGETIITDNKTGNNHIIQLPYGSSMSNDNIWKKLIFTPDSSKLFLIQTYAISSVDIENGFRQDWIEGFELYDNIFYRNNSNSLITRSILNTRYNNPPSLFSNTYQRLVDLENPLTGSDVNTDENPMNYAQTSDGTILVGNLQQIEAPASNYIYSWDLNTGKYIKRMVSAIPLTFSYDNNKIVVMQEDYSIEIYNYEQSSLITKIPANREYCSGIVQFSPVFRYPVTSTGIALFSPDDRYLVTSGPSKICIWDISNSSLVKSIIRPSSITSMVFTKDGVNFLIGESDGTISIWNSNTWTFRSSLLDFSKRITDMSISNNGSLLAVSAVDSPIRIYDTDLFDNYSSIPTKETITSLSFSGDDKLLAAFSIEGPNCFYGLRSSFQENEWGMQDLSMCSGTAIFYPISK